MRELIDIKEFFKCLVIAAYCLTRLLNQELTMAKQIKIPRLLINVNL